MKALPLTVRSAITGMTVFPITYSDKYKTLHKMSFNVTIKT